MSVNAAAGVKAADIALLSSLARRCPDMQRLCITGIYIGSCKAWHEGADMYAAAPGMPQLQDLLIKYKLGPLVVQ